MTNTIERDCDTCGQTNRVPVDLPPGKVAICGACKEPFDPVDDVDDDTDDDDDGV